MLQLNLHGGGGGWGGGLLSRDAQCNLTINSLTAKG